MANIDTIALADQFLDRRTRLLDCQKEQVKRLREQGLSYQKLADIFKVSKRLIEFIIKPEALAENRKHRKANAPKYHCKKKNTAAKKNLRDYKRELLNS